MEDVRQRSPDELSHAEKFMVAKLEEELKKFNNPAADKTRKLFSDYRAIDVTVAWHWNDVDVDKEREKLDALVRKRQRPVQQRLTLFRKMIWIKRSGS